jgi:hypothetical protein
MKRYYSLLRPVSIGTYPKPGDNKVLEIKNFDNRTYCEDIGREAWGYIDYEKVLTPKDANIYDLMPGENN